MAASLATDGAGTMRERQASDGAGGDTAWLAACAPEVGSPRWCEAMREKPRGDWTANEALEFARSCVL